MGIIVTEMPGASEGQVSPWTARAAHAVDTIARALAELDGAEFQHSRYTRAAKAVVASLYGATWARACHSVRTIVRADVENDDLWDASHAAIAADAADAALGLYEDHLAAAYDQAVR
jgi:hypothetical protein